MIRRLLLSVVAVFVLGAAAATVVVAAAFALYALLDVRIGRPGAAAVVAVVFAIIAGLIGLLVASQARGSRRRPSEESFAERLGEMARERPILAAVGALAAGVIALKNPQVVAGIVSAVLASRAADKTGRRNRR